MKNEKLFYKMLNNAQIGVYINCNEIDFITLIMQLKKTMETRNKNTLKRFVGYKVGLIKSGNKKPVLVGYCTISGYKVYDNKKSFYNDYNLHYIKENSNYRFKNKKFGYYLTNIEMLKEPVALEGPNIFKSRTYRNI